MSSVCRLNLGHVLVRKIDNQIKKLKSDIHRKIKDYNEFVSKHDQFFEERRLR